MGRTAFGTFCSRDVLCEDGGIDAKLDELHSTLFALHLGQNLAGAFLKLSIVGDVNVGVSVVLPHVEVLERLACHMAQPRRNSLTNLGILLL